MSRSGYTDDLDNWSLIRWRGRVASASKGKRGQRLFHELLKALDAMPDKSLITGDLVTNEGDCCTIGSVLLHRGTEDPQRYHEDNESLAGELDVAECLVREIEWMNDDYGSIDETPSKRWERMREWVESQIKR